MDGGPQIKELYSSFTEKIKKWNKLQKQSKPIMEALQSELEAKEADIINNASVLPLIDDKIAYFADLQTKLAALIEEMLQIQQQAYSLCSSKPLQAVVDRDKLNGMSFSDVVDFIVTVYTMHENEYQAKAAILASLNQDTPSAELSTYLLVYGFQPFMDARVISDFQKKWEIVTGKK